MSKVKVVLEIETDTPLSELVIDVEQNLVNNEDAYQGWDIKSFEVIPDAKM